jgi:UDP-N-acetylglucosamine 2-epimerase
MVIVYGDTNTTMAAALAAAKLHIPLAHIEAGLRSYNKSMPEEINRVLTDHVSALLFAPTDAAVKNLTKESITAGVHFVGDVMYDLALLIDHSTLTDQASLLAQWKLESDNFILTTIHRADNTDVKENFENIWKALTRIANGGIKVFFPVHPRTKNIMEKYGVLKSAIPENLIIAEPVGYKSIICLEKNAGLIITDSGGVQKEGYFFKTPCIIPRKETEWVELVTSGWNHVVGANENAIFDTAMKVLNQSYDRKKYAYFYGDGNASKKIIDVIKNYQ